MTWTKAKETDLEHFKRNADNLEHEKQVFLSKRRKPLKEFIKSLKEFNDNGGENGYIGNAQSYMYEHVLVRLLEENADGFLKALEPFRRNENG